MNKCTVCEDSVLIAHLTLYRVCADCGSAQPSGLPLGCATGFSLFCMCRLGQEHLNQQNLILHTIVLTDLATENGATHQLMYFSVVLMTMSSPERTLPRQE